MSDLGNASAQNTCELWRERENDYYADSIHVTAGGGIGINCGGTVITMPVRAWHGLSARVTDLQGLLYRVVNHGDASGDAELIADIQRATPEAGWTDNAGGAPGPEPRSPHHIADVNKMVSSPSHHPGEPAPDLPDIFTQAAATLGPLAAIAREVAQPRPAQSPAGAVSSIDHQQSRGIAWDIVDEAILTYDDWTLDDDYDPYGTLHKIIEKMRERRNAAAPR